MSDNPFAPPATATGIKWEDHKGDLLLVEPKAYETEITTAYGPSDAVRADVTVVAKDGTATETFNDVLIFPKVLVSQTKSLVGQMILARLIQGAAKPGQSPPWMLDEANAADTKVGLKFLESRKETTFVRVGPDDL